jgi:hypothetical protein
MKPTLKINQKDLKNPLCTLGMSEILTYLLKSGLFNVEYHDERLKGLKCERATILYCNEKKIYLDFWEYSAPTYTDIVFDYNFDLIIKLQHLKVTHDIFNQICIKRKLFLNHPEEERQKFLDKVVPWTFFCSRLMRQFVGNEDNIIKEPTEILGFFCGKGWKCRHGMEKRLIQDGVVEYIHSSQEEKHKRPLSDLEYIRKMKTSKYGIVLHGRHSFLSNCKNRREMDYMMLKKPLLLNYRPYYYDPLIEGKHYIYIDEKTDLKNLENIYNIDEIAANGYEWYKNNASPMGLSNMFLKIMKDRFPDDFKDC